MVRIMDCDPIMTVYGYLGPTTVRGAETRFSVVYVDSAGNTVVLRCRTSDAGVVAKKKPLYDSRVTATGYVQFTGEGPLLTVTDIEAQSRTTDPFADVF